MQREWVFGQDRAGVTAIARQGAEWVQREAARYPRPAGPSSTRPESFTATEPDYAVEVCEAVLDVWQPTPQRPCIINLPATVEVASPNVFADQVEYFATHIVARDGDRALGAHPQRPRRRGARPRSWRCLAGADRVEGTLLGNGERTGNLDIVTLAMNLYSQGIDPGLDLSDPDEIVRVVERMHRHGAASAPPLGRRAGLHGLLGQSSGRDPQESDASARRVSPGRSPICRSIRAIWVAAIRR